MPCEGESIEEMAAMGMTEQEIELLQLEIELARDKVIKLAYQAGMNPYQQKSVEDMVTKREREVAHDRFHRRQEAENRQFFASLGNIAERVEKKSG